MKNLKHDAFINMCPLFTKFSMFKYKTAFLLRIVN